MELRDLQYFLVLADELHFRRAAKRLFITPSSLSKSISRLERSLGLELVERSPRRVALTPAGEQVAVTANEIAEGVDRLELLAAETRSRLATEGAGAGTRSDARSLSARG